MVLQELKFSMSELVDPAKARKLGQMLGVQGLVLGRVSDVGSTLDLDARIIDIQTDVSLPGASASIVKDEAVSKMASECGARFAPPIHNEPEQPPLLPPSAVGPVVVEDFKFETTSCVLSGTSLTCHLVVTNDSRQDRDVAFKPYKTRAIDNSGSEYKCLRYRFGSKQARYNNIIDWPTLVNTLVTGTPTNLVLGFENVSADASRVALLEITCSIGYGGPEFVARVRNIPINR
jgi:hypothetical protein